MQKVVVITGATGTLGSKLLEYHVKNEDVVFALSRCDHKISQWSVRYPKVQWCLGDIRDLKGCLPPSAHIVYHCAALKHVHMGEAFPHQYHAVNYQGTINVFEAINAQKLVYFSTDKAVLPINVYGMTKALAEMHLLSIKKQTGRDIQIFRWGNIIGSQGSVLSGFINQLRAENPVVNITHPDMTRFWLKIDDAISYVTFHSDRVKDLSNEKKDVYIHPNIKAAYVRDMVQAIANVLGIEAYETKITGIRPGEKIHEHLKSDHDSCIRSDTAEKYTMEELTELVRPAVVNYISGNNV